MGKILKKITLPDNSTLDIATSNTLTIGKDKISFDGSEAKTITASNINQTLSFNNSSTTYNGSSAITVSGSDINKPLTIGSKTYNGGEAVTVTASNINSALTIGSKTYNGSNAISVSASDINKTLSIGSKSYNGSSDISVSAGDINKTLTVGSKTYNGSSAISVAASDINKTLTIGSETYDGSAAVTITAATLGLSQALKFVGTTSSNMYSGQYTMPTGISSASIGDVVLSNSGGEFVWLGIDEESSADGWQELGSENSYALKTITITGSNGLIINGTANGSGSLSNNITISMPYDSTAASNLAWTASAGSSNYAARRDHVHSSNFQSNVQANNIFTATSNVNFTGGASKYFITNTTSNFGSNVNFTNSSATFTVSGASNFNAGVTLNKAASFNGKATFSNKIILNSTTMYGTSEPGAAVSSPVAGQIYFKLVT